MKYITMGGILLLNLMIQSTIFPYFGIYGIQPDSLIAIVVSYALFNGAAAGATIGFFGGLLQDIVFGQYIGLFALLYMLVGYLSGLVYRRIYIDRVVLPVFFSFSAYIVKEIILLAILFFIRIEVPVSLAFFRYMLPGSIATSVLMLVIHFGMSRLHQYKFMTKKWRIGYID